MDRTRVSSQDLLVLPGGVEYFLLCVCVCESFCRDLTVCLLRKTSGRSSSSLFVAVKRWKNQLALTLLSFRPLASLCVCVCVCLSFSLSLSELVFFRQYDIGELETLAVSIAWKRWAMKEEEEEEGMEEEEEEEEAMETNLILQSGGNRVIHHISWLLMVSRFKRRALINDR